MNKEKKIKEKLPFKVGKLLPGFSVWEQVMWDREQEELRKIWAKKKNETQKTKRKR